MSPAAPNVARDPHSYSRPDEVFSLTASGNDQILSRWLVGPIYRELAATPEGRERAAELYARARPGYHGILRATIDGVLAGEE